MIGEWRFINKGKWAKGPWQKEPDKVQWRDKHTGYPCLIVRSKMSGALCGYVGLTKRHRWFKKGYPDIDVDVHGGLTYADMCMEDDKEHGVCHIVQQGEDDKVWWLGFDCAHAFDLMPGFEARSKELHERLGQPKYGMPKTGPFASHYRDMEFVKREVTKLAGQLKEGEHAD